MQNLEGTESGRLQQANIIFCLEELADLWRTLCLEFPYCSLEVYLIKQHAFYLSMFYFCYAPWLFFATLWVLFFFYPSNLPLTLCRRERIEGEGGMLSLDYFLLIRGVEFLGASLTFPVRTWLLNKLWPNPHNLSGPSIEILSAVPQIPDHTWD